MIVLTQAQLDALIDGIFSYAETALGARLFLRVALEGIHAAVKAGLDALYKKMVADGIIRNG